MTDREAALSGALVRAVILIRMGWANDDILERLSRDFPQISTRQQRLMIRLGYLGVNACIKMDWQDIQEVVQAGQWPSMPEG